MTANKPSAPPTSSRVWQRMLSGRRLDLLDPSPVDVEIADIAHGLARVARWNGQTSGAQIFSVAQHTLLVEAVMREHTPRVDARVRLLDPTGPYGAGQVSVAGFSDVYQTFGGGIGQIAIHGTDQPNLIGQGVSHGCVRVTNPQILRLLAVVPTGAPVDILP